MPFQIMPYHNIMCQLNRLSYYCQTPKHKTFIIPIYLHSENIFFLIKFMINLCAFLIEN